MKSVIIHPINKKEAPSQNGLVRNSAAANAPWPIPLRKNLYIMNWNDSINPQACAIDGAAMLNAAVTNHVHSVTAT